MVSLNHTKRNLPKESLKYLNANNINFCGIIGNAVSKDAEEKILAAPAIKEVLMNSFETNPNDIIVS